jgi:hypothetical protein
MADVATRNGPVLVFPESGARMPMAIETKSVKPRLGPRAKIRPLASVALDAEGCARAVGIVVVAREAIHRAVLVVRKIERQPARTAKRGLPE